MTITYKLPKDPLGNVIPNVVGKYVDDKKVMSIPFVTGNTDYEIYLKWVSEGNTADPAD